MLLFSVLLRLLSWWCMGYGGEEERDKFSLSFVVARTLAVLFLLLALFLVHTLIYLASEFWKWLRG